MTRSTTAGITVTTVDVRTPAAVAEMSTSSAVVGAVKVPSGPIAPRDAVHVAATPIQELPEASVAVAVKRSVLAAATLGERGSMDKKETVAGMIVSSTEFETEPDVAVTMAVPVSDGAV